MDNMAEHNSSKSPLASLAETLRYRPSIHSCGKFRGSVLCVSVDDISTIWRGGTLWEGSLYRRLWR